MRFVRTAESIFGLPIGFQRVECLQSSGTQYIDTGVYPTQLTEVEYRCAVTGSVANNDSHLFGSRLSASSEAFDLAYMNTSANGIEKFRFIHGTTTTQETTTSVTASQLANPHTYYMSGTSFKVDGSEKMSFTTASFTGTYSLWLFGVNSAGSLHNQVRAQKVYRCKIWDNGLLVRDFIPCIDPLGVPCMYALVGKKPYYNAGSGTFTVGRQVIPVEYLESTGTQYIDTGVLLTDNSRIEITSQSTDASQSNNTLVGCGTSNSSSDRVQVHFGSAAGTLSERLDGVLSENQAVGTTKFNAVLDIKNKKAYFNGEEIISTFSGSICKTVRVAIFNRMVNGNVVESNFYAKSKVYSCKFYDNNTLVRDFIPCKDENNVGFMLDTLTGIVYLNAGTGAFSVGENKYTSKLRLVKEAKELPAGYKRVEYLQSDGNQYIDTGIIPANKKISAEVSFKLNSIVNNLTNGIIGSNNRDGQNNFQFQVYSNQWRTKLNNFASFNGTWNTNNHIIKLNTSSGTTLDSTIITSNQYIITSDNNYSMWLFSVHYLSQTDVYNMRGCIYYCKIWDNGTLVRDFIPCLDSNNRPCMYDRVNGVTYYNQGTGDFTYGHIITPVEYIESTGTQYIDTGIKLDNNSSVELDYQLTQAVQNRKGLFGGLDTGGSKRFGALLSPSNNQLESGYGSGNEFYQLGLPDTNRHIMKQEKNLLYFDGSLVYTFNTATFTQSFNAPLGNFNFTNYNPASAKYYRSKWWDNGTLVRSFIPVRDENNVGYMFDEVTGQLFGNAGSGSFVIGNDLKTPKVRFIQDVLPREYRPLKYIQSTGTQYIDTGVNAKSTLKTDIYFEVVDKTQGGHIFGGRTVTSGGRGYGVYLPTSGGIGFDYETRLSSNVSTTNGYRYRVVKDGASNTLYVNGVQSYTGNNTAATFNLNVAIALFYMKDSNTSFNASVKCKVFDFKIYDGGVPVRDFYPAIRKSDNKPGMYDRITKQFFVNQGTGEFNYG